MPEAAAVLGMTVDAVRGRIRRGTLDSEREGGTVYVYVDTDRRGPSPTVEGPSPDESPALLVEELRDRIRYLERQVEEEKDARQRADMLLAQLVSKVPELEAPPEPQNQAESAEPRSDRGTPPEEPPRPFWRRWIGR